jgi:hypothetical protein
MATETFLRFGALYRQENTFLAGPFRAGQEWGPCACIRAGSRGRCRIAGPTPGERWSSPLVATASENGLSFRRNPHTPVAAASDCGGSPWEGEVAG